MGAISAIGTTVAENRSSLVQGKYGIGTLGLFPSAYAGKLPCGEIKITTGNLKKKLKIDVCASMKFTLTKYKPAITA